ncbi:Cytochrome c551/c552 [hydrothermal vent metagenome]|uniref:Cytochrome c551/c552 n=1 Tax=hydrothermal vent metagenome TaxID=652676 RepID=A0A1W1D2K6_9ZZZZ
MKKTVVFTMIMAGSLFAQVESKIEVPEIHYAMKQAKGFETFQANCSMCHSFGYILNQGLQSHKFWEEKVQKMRNAFHAPIADKDAKVIVEYLYKNYGNGKLK